MNLPVRDIDTAIPFYESKMGFRVASRSDDVCRKAVLERDTIQIGLAENGGDPAQEGCFFEVDDVEAAVAELRSYDSCLLYTSPSPRDRQKSRMPSSA